MYLVILLTMLYSSPSKQSVFGPLFRSVNLKQTDFIVGNRPTDTNDVEIMFTIFITYTWCINSAE